MKKPLALGLALVVLGMSIAGLKLRLDRIPRRKIPGSSIIYIPSGTYLKPATFGYTSLAADIVYLWAIQYYGDDTIPDRFRYFTHIFSIISELDPGFIDPYEVGALIAIYDRQDVPLAFSILDLGLAKNPGQWIFPLEAGHYAQLYLKDYPLAQRYYKKVMDIPGSPDIAKRLYAAAAFKSDDLKTAWTTWVEVFQTAADPQVKKIASNHLYEVKAAADAAAIKAALEKYRSAFGRLPESLEDLARAGILGTVPKDFDDKDYAYDPATGEVKTQVIPWKR